MILKRVYTDEFDKLFNGTIVLDDWARNDLAQIYYQESEELRDD